MPFTERYINREVILSAEVYSRDIRFHVFEKGMKIISAGNGGSTRGSICRYSEKSKRNYKFKLRNTRDIWTHEMELGYGRDYPEDGRIVKGHRKLFVEALQRKYRGIAWTWRLGFQQERGKKGLGYAPHFHFLVDRFVHHDWLAKTWARIVGSKDLNHIKAGTHVDKIRNVGKMIYYMVNYMSKDIETEVPDGFENVGRFWGIKRGLVEVEEYRKVLPHWMAGRSIRLFRRWYRAELRSWGIYKWSPGRMGRGFTVIGGKRLFDVLMKLNR
jgi:hypothetical protein